MSVLRAVGVVVCSVLAGVASDAACRRFVYSRPAFASAKASFARLSRSASRAAARSGASPASVSSGAARAADKELRVARDGMAASEREIARFRLAAAAVSAVVTFATFLIASFLCDGSTPVLRLPFTPPWLVRGFTGLGIDGERAADASVSFVFALASLSLRSYATAALGGDGGDMADAGVSVGVDEDESGSGSGPGAKQGKK